MFDLIGQDFKKFYDVELSGSSRAHILTQRVGPRATTDLEISLKVNEQSNLYDVCNSMGFLMTATGMWDVPHEMVMKKGPIKNFRVPCCSSEKKNYQVTGWFKGASKNQFLSAPPLIT